MPGEIGSEMWPLFAPSLWGKLPFSVGWLTGEILGNMVDGIGTSAVQIFNRRTYYQLEAGYDEMENHP